MEGLHITLDEFECLPVKKQLRCIYQNQVAFDKKLESISRLRRRQSLQWGWLGLLSAWLLTLTLKVWDALVR